MDRCNFRCPYCMPEDKYHKDFQFLKSSERLSFEEILRLAQLFAGLGVKKLRITGGEPLLRPNLPDLVGDLSRVEGIDDVALTTNGVLLAQHAAALKAAGLARVTVSLDSLDDEVFLAMNGGRGNKERVLEGISEAIQAGLTPLKINTVVIRGVNDRTVLDLIEHFRGTGVIVRFIEYMDVGTINHWQRADTVPSRELVRMIGERWPLKRRGQQLPRRGGEPLRVRGRPGRGRIHFLGDGTVLRFLHPRPPVIGRAALHLPVRCDRHRPQGAAARRRVGRRAARASSPRSGTGASDRYSELRAALKTRHRQGRDVLHRWVIPAARFPCAAWPGRVRGTTPTGWPSRSRWRSAWRLPGSPPEGESLVITMRTPGHDEDLACGFLFTEGLIGEPADILGVSVVADAGRAAGGNVLQIVQWTCAATCSERMRNLRRNFYTNSSCGICGKASLEALRARARLEVRGEDLRVSPAVLQRAAGCAGRAPAQLRIDRRAARRRAVRRRRRRFATSARTSAGTTRWTSSSAPRCATDACRSGISASS